MASMMASSFCEVSGLFTPSLQRMDSERGSLSSSRCSDQVYKGTSEEIIRCFYENNLHTDVTINVKCGDGYISFPCHKLVLSMRSPVFALMFYGEKADDEIWECDVPPSAFEAVIKFCYGLKTELDKNRDDVKFLLKVYRAAKKYDIEALQTYCCEKFNSTFPTRDNVFELLDASSLIGSDSLKGRCYKVLQSQTEQILSSRDICTVTPNVIDVILDMEDLSFDSEYELIRWLFGWGLKQRARCEEQGSGKTLKEIMEPFLPRMYFLSLTPVQFGLLLTEYKEIVSKESGLFDESEGFAIFMNIVCDGSRDLPSWCSDSRIYRCSKSSVSDR